MNKEIVVNSNVDIVTYSMAVTELAKKFFDEDGNYTPHFGRMNAVGVFFNYFVEPVSLESYFSDEEAELNLDFLLANNDCLEVYDKAVRGEGIFRLDFANAYKDCLAIVEYKKNSFGNIVDGIKKMLVDIAEKISPVLSGENLEKLMKIANEVSSGNLSADSIVEAYRKPNKAKEEIKSE